jgi:hypothetical protein
MSPDEMQKRRVTALRLLEGGKSSLRAVAAAVGAHHSSVRAWRLEAERTGAVPELRFDRHGTGGSVWDDDDALKRQVVRAARVARRAGRDRRPAVPLKTGALDALASDALSESNRWRRARKPRARVMGPRLRRHLGLPVIIVEDAEIVASPAVAQSTEPPIPAWVGPTLRTKISAVLAHWAGARGMPIRALRAHLGAAFEVDDSDPDSWYVDAVLERVLPDWGFVQTAERRWLVPPPPE